MTARDILDLAWLIPAFPAVGAGILLLFGKRIGEPRAGWLATLMMALSFDASLITFFALRSLAPEARANVSQGFTWIQAGTFRVDFRFLVDPLSSTMTLFVTGVGTLIHLYAIGYMHGDARFSRFFAYMNLFAASMLVLVLGSSFLLTFLGWEGVGLCSYLLISFWFERNSAAVAGKKAFITNRVGDFGFMLAMFLIFQKLGTLNYSALGGAEKLPQSAVTAIALLLFVGAMGKSAQLPLHIWLPDAMEGPTPVSALIHAATMVTAGVFLLVRAHVFFDVSEHAATIVAWFGAITALYAATVALVQNDIKRVLAYSTISQLGYMFLAVGVGAYSAAIFHMITHAFFKALLFLGAGSVIHGMHDQQDMRRMGGLRRFMPITAGTFIVGWLAISGIIPFAGFWSKDEILTAAWDKNIALWAVGFVTALLTAFYMSRQVFLVFFGDQRWNDTPESAGGEAEQSAEAVDDDEETASVHAAASGSHGHGDPHDPPWTMAAPLVILAVGAAFAGFINLPFGDETKRLELWLAPVLEGVEHHADVAGALQLALALATAVLCFGAILVARRVYLQRKIAAERFEPQLFAHGWYYDEGVTAFVGGPGEEAFDATARFDKGIIDGAVDGVAAIVRWVASKVRLTQTGYVRNYALGIAVGAFILVGLFLTKAGG